MILARMKRIKKSEEIKNNILKNFRSFFAFKFFIQLFGLLLYLIILYNLFGYLLKPLKFLLILQLPYRKKTQTCKQKTT